MNVEHHRAPRIQKTKTFEISKTMSAIYSSKDWKRRLPVGSEGMPRSFNPIDFEPDFKRTETIHKGKIIRLRYTSRVLNRIEELLEGSVE